MLILGTIQLILNGKKATGADLMSAVFIKEAPGFEKEFCFFLNKCLLYGG